MAEEQTLEVTIQNIVFQSDQGDICVFSRKIGISGAVSVVYKNSSFCRRKSAPYWVVD